MFTKESLKDARSVIIDQTDWEEEPQPVRVLILNIPEMGSIKGFSSKDKGLVWFAPCEVVQIVS
jgi:hypothetical protein